MPTTTTSEPERSSAILLTLEADLTEDGSFGRRTLELTADRVIVRDDAGVTVANVPVSEVKSARNEPLVSGGRLLVGLKSGEELALISYTQGKANRFGDLARGIEQLAQGEALTVTLKEQKLKCEKCGRLLPEPDSLCPSCVNRGKTMLRIAGYLGPYKSQAILLAVCACMATGLNLAPPAIQAQVIDHFTKNQRELPFLWQMVGLWGVVIVCAAALQIFNGRLMTFLSAHISADLRAATYRAIEFLQLNYFDKKPVGAIASRVTQDTERIWSFLVDGLPFLVINSLMLIFVMVLLFSTNWMLALAILTPIPIVAFISMRIWKPISNMFHKVSQKMARVHMHLSESFSGIRVVKAFANEDHEYRRFQQRSNELRNAAQGAEQTWNLYFGLMTLAVSTGTLIHWTYGGWMLFTGKLTLGQFYMVNAYLGLVYGPLQWFAQINNWFSRAMAGAERIFEVMDTTPEPVHREGVDQRIQGDVTFENVRFGYDKSNPVIKGVSFEVKAGEMIGLVGQSGAGKSTTINLVGRFYEPDGGRILVDGIDVRDFDLRAYRRQIGIVLQEPFLFHGTIAENIMYGSPGASLEDVMKAAKAANAHDFIMNKPDGYDTVVGERGGRLSGGEKQRISIARAILHNPRVLILDEATSSVDVETEKMIQEAIHNLIDGRTVFAIAHRLSTLRKASRLFVMERGQLVESGTHEELLAKKGAFFQLVQAQSQIHETMGVEV